VPAQAPAAAARSSPQPVAAAASGPDAGAIARFRIDLLKIVALDKKYPRIAQDNDWTGTVELGVAVGADGLISSITVTKSSGHAVLDDEAQSMIRTAQSRMAIPPALSGTAFDLDVSVSFYSKDEDR
jgi:protein TonB